MNKRRRWCANEIDLAKRTDPQKFEQPKLLHGFTILWIYEFATLGFEKVISPNNASG